MSCIQDIAEPTAQQDSARGCGCAKYVWSLQAAAGGGGRKAGEVQGAALWAESIMVMGPQIVGVVCTIDSLLRNAG